MSCRMKQAYNVIEEKAKKEEETTHLEVASVSYTHVLEYCLLILHYYTLYKVYIDLHT